MTEKELPYLLNTNPAAKLTRAAKSDRIQLLTVENFNERRIPINVWAILIFLTYVIIGIAFYSFGPSQLSALDSVYLAVITFSTVGYGKLIACEPRLMVMVLQVILKLILDILLVSTSYWASP